jgi:hypothetical protein
MGRSGAESEAGDSAAVVARPIPPATASTTVAMSKVRTVTSILASD